MTHDTCHLIWQSHLASVPSLGSALWHCQRAPSFAVHIGALRLGNRDQVEVSRVAGSAAKCFLMQPDMSQACAPRVK